jgi:hypothetical protein
MKSQESVWMLPKTSTFLFHIFKKLSLAGLISARAAVETAMAGNVSAMAGKETARAELVTARAGSESAKAMNTTARAGKESARAKVIAATVGKVSAILIIAIEKAVSIIIALKMKFVMPPSEHKLYILLTKDLKEKKIKV